MYLITKTVQGCRYYLGKGIWQGLRDNAEYFNEYESEFLITKLKTENPSHEYTTIPTLKQHITH